MPDPTTQALTDVAAAHWRRGVEDSIKIVEQRRRTLIAICGGDEGAGMKVAPAALTTLNEIVVFLQAMLARGEYTSRTPLAAEGR